MRQGSTLALVGLALLMVATPTLAGSPWVLPDESQGTRVAPMFLLSRPEVREDLGLTPDVCQQVEKAIEDLFEKASAIKGKTGEAAVAQRKHVDEIQKTWLESHLALDQVDRLAQIDLRWEGFAAIATRSSVAATLSLSDEQKAAFQRAVAERNAQREKQKDHRAADQLFTQRALSILNPGQRETWTRMLGRPLALKPVSPSATTNTATATATAPKSPPTVIR